MEYALTGSSGYAALTAGHPFPKPEDVALRQTFSEEDVWSAHRDSRCELISDHGDPKNIPGFSPVSTHRELALVFAGRTDVRAVTIEALAEALQAPQRSTRIVYHSGDLNRRALRFALEGAGIRIGAMDPRHGYPTYRLLAEAARRDPGALVLGLRGAAAAASTLHVLAVGGSNPQDAGATAAYPIQYEVTMYARACHTSAMCSLVKRHLLRVWAIIQEDRRHVFGSPVERGRESDSGPLRCRLSA